MERDDQKIFSGIGSSSLAGRRRPFDIKFHFATKIQVESEVIYRQKVDINGVSFVDTPVRVLKFFEDFLEQTYEETPGVFLPDGANFELGLQVSGAAIWDDRGNYWPSPEFKALREDFLIFLKQVKCVEDAPV